MFEYIVEDIRYGVRELLRDEERTERVRRALGAASMLIPLTLDMFDNDHSLIGTIETLAKTGIVGVTTYVSTSFFEVAARSWSTPVHELNRLIHRDPPL